MWLKRNFHEINFNDLVVRPKTIVLKIKNIYNLFKTLLCRLDKSFYVLKYLCSTTILNLKPA